MLPLVNDPRKVGTIANGSVPISTSLTKPRELKEERARLHHELGMVALPTPMRERAQEVCRHIDGDFHEMPITKWASQNLTEAVLLRTGPKPATLQEKKLL
jgi:hypothetical protein